MRFLIGVSEGEIPETTLSPRYLYHHAKLYIADETRAVVSSSNLSAQGLIHSTEAGITIQDSDDVRYFVERFDYYFKKAVPVADELLAKLEEWLHLYTPYEIYIRSLLELYGLPEEEESAELPILAGYQRPIVSRVLRNMDVHGGAMLVASTGLGKTIMAAHVVAYLHMQRIIEKAIILCPAGLKSMWHRTMRAAHVSSEEFSYYILSLENTFRYRDIVILENELRRANKKTIIILDESHHLRNMLDGKELRLRHTRIIDMVNKEAKILLMTATPYSREVEDINAQLMLLPPYVSGQDLFGEPHKKYWRISKPADISEVPCSVVLTAPSVVKHFSIKDESNEHYVLFSKGEKRYFPRKIHMRNVAYKNPCDAMLIELLRSGLLNVRSNETGEGILIDTCVAGYRDALFEARVVHQFCSSVKQIDSLFSKMEQENGFDKLRFENQEILADWVAKARIEIQPFLSQQIDACNDEKIQKVVSIIQSFPGRKAVIFCYYRETSKYIAECLRKLLPGIKVEHTVDKKVEEIEQLIRRFAPLSNSIDLENGEEYIDEAVGRPVDILVATTALSEGFNFQDASVLINFDLPWTVLVLAQRMGRILRPWKEPREIFIFTMVPSTMENEKIYHALNWKNRLIKRNEEYTSFADIPVIVEKHDSEFEMINLARSVQQFGDVVLDLDQVFEFIEKADHLKTSGFIDDLASLGEQEIKKFGKLPYGIKSYKKTALRKPMLYVLFNHKTRSFPAIFNYDGSIELNSNNMDEIMSTIRSSPDDEAYISEIGPDDLDHWLKKSCNEWAAANGYMPDDIKIMCYMVLVP